MDDEQSIDLMRGAGNRTIVTSVEADPTLAQIEIVAGVGSLCSIVVGHDRQPQSKMALDIAIELAGRLSAHLHVVHALDLVDVPVDPDLADWEKQTRDVLARDRAEVAATLGDYRYGWTYHAGHGDPARFLIRVADEYEALMIIVGSRGEGVRASVGRLGLAPVSHRLVQHSKQPVLIVRHGLEHLDSR